MKIQSLDMAQVSFLVSALSTMTSSMKIGTMIETMTTETMQSHLSTCASEEQTVRLVHDSWKVWEPKKVPSMSMMMKAFSACGLRLLVRCIS